MGLTPSSRLVDSVTEVLRIALPLMVSTGMFSVVLFTDRTLLLWYGDGSEMSAAMAGGTSYWLTTCLPAGIASMTGAIVAQLIGSGREREVGRFLWQTMWFALATIPLFLLIGLYSPKWFELNGQPPELVGPESTYLRILMVGAIGMMIENGLAGFFNGIQRTRIIMWASLASALVNVVLDVWLIFGGLGIPAMGIAGAAWASVVSFWFKAVVYVAVILRPAFEERFAIRGGFGWDWPMLRKLLFFGTPSGLGHLIEAAAFTFIVLQIGRLGDIPLRATTMAMNFNLVAFIPLIGVSIATSVLVGHHLTSGGPAGAIHAVRAALAIGLAYSLLWAALYVFAADGLLALYRLGQSDTNVGPAIGMAKTLFAFIAIYVFLDSVQLILTGALRGAGDTWFVLAASIVSAGVSLLAGWWWIDTLHRDHGITPLNGWWGVITLWVWLLAVIMIVRYKRGRWQGMRMVS